MQFKTKDIDDAAFFWEKGFALKDVIVEQGLHREIVFLILENDKISEQDFNKMKEDYDKLLASVEPKSFSRRQHDVRNIVHRKLRENSSK